MKGEAAEELRLSLRRVTLARLLRAASAAGISHAARRRAELAALVAEALAFDEEGSRFDADDLSQAARRELVQLEAPVAGLDAVGLARLHAMVSDCDSWYLAYSFRAGGHLVTQRQA